MRIHKETTAHMSGMFKKSHLGAWLITLCFQLFAIFVCFTEIVSFDGAGGFGGIINEERRPGPYKKN